MSQTIIALSGKKQSGKNTATDHIGRVVLKNVGGPDLSHPAKAWSHSSVGSVVYSTSFAEDLKTFCTDVLGLEEHQCWGSDEEKNMPTTYMWGNVPRFWAWKFSDHKFRTPSGFLEQLVDPTDGPLLEEYYFSRVSRGCIPEGARSGPMTGREIMQIFGTECIRNVFGNIWVSSTLRRIKKVGKPVNLVSDCRFPNEVEAILEQPNGYVLRLLRDPCESDSHSSETALDNYDWGHPNVFVIDNRDMTIEEQNAASEPIFQKILG
jgi:hypothetical protein